MSNVSHTMSSCTHIHACTHTQMYIHTIHKYTHMHRFAHTCVQKPLCLLTATTIADPTLSFLDIKRILLQKIRHKADELGRAFQLLDPAQSGTVSTAELQRVISTFLLPLTREQCQDVLAQVGGCEGGGFRA